MKEIASDPRVLSLVKIHGITNIIGSLENQLNRCQSTLTAFINVRFYEIKVGFLFHDSHPNLTHHLLFLFDEISRQNVMHFLGFIFLAMMIC